MEAYIMVRYVNNFKGNGKDLSLENLRVAYKYVTSFAFFSLFAIHLQLLIHGTAPHLQHIDADNRCLDITF